MLAYIPIPRVAVVTVPGYAHALVDLYGLAGQMQWHPWRTSYRTIQGRWKVSPYRVRQILRALESMEMLTFDGTTIEVFPPDGIEPGEIVTDWCSRCGGNGGAWADPCGQCDGTGREGKA